MRSYEILVGRTTDKERITIDIELRVQPGTLVRADTHTPVEWADPLELAVSACVYPFRAAEPTMAGQCVEEVRRVTDYAAGWDENRVRRLLWMWQRYHLNAMKAGCDHVTPLWEDSEWGRRPDLTNTPSCPWSGYRYGSAWLYRPLPAYVIEEARSMQSLAVS